MAYFQYYIGQHLYRPSSITNNTSYTGVDSANQQAYNSAQSLPVVTMTGDYINLNFFNLANAAIDNTYRINILEAKSQVSDSPIPGYVSFGGRQESEGTLYGGDTFVAPGSTAITFPYTLDNGNVEAFRMAVGDGIAYLLNGNIDTTNSKFRTFTFGEAGVGSPWSAPPDPLIIYLKSKLAGNSRNNPDTKVSYIKGNFDTSSQTWGSGAWWNSTFGSLTAVPRSFYVGINDKATSSYAKVTLNSNILTPAAMVSAINNGINGATVSLGAASAVVVSLNSNFTLVTPNYDRTSGGVFQITLMVDPSDPGGSSDNLLSWLGLLPGTNTTVEAFDYSSVISFYYSLISSWTVSGTCSLGAGFSINGIPYITTGTTDAAIATQIGSIIQTGYQLSTPSTSVFQIVPNYGYLLAAVIPPAGMTFTYGGVTNYRIGIVGQQSYSKFSFIDNSLSPVTPFLATYGISTVTQNYYHTKPPLVSYQKLLNYGGDFRARDGYFRNLTLSGILTYSSSAWIGTSSFQNITASGTIAVTGALSAASLAITNGASILGNINLQVGNAGSAMTIGTDSTNTLAINSSTQFNNPVVITKTLAIGGISLDGVNNAISSVSATIGTINVTNLNVSNLNFTGNFGVASTVITPVNGKFDAGTTAPTNSGVRLNYVGDLYAYKFGVTYQAAAGAVAVSAAASGSSFMIQANTSDRRLKNNIKPTTLGLNAVMQLDPVTFGVKGEEGESIGFIAQDLRKVIPYAVFGEEAPDKYLGINLDYVVPVLTKAIQDQQVIINDLKDKLDKLGNRDIRYKI
jgi:hypothetical protein